MVLEESTTTAALSLRELRAENFLIPTLKEGQVLIVDNLKAHKKGDLGCGS